MDPSLSSISPITIGIITGAPLCPARSVGAGNAVGHQQSNRPLPEPNRRERATDLQPGTDSVPTIVLKIDLASVTRHS